MVMHMGAGGKDRGSRVWAPLESRSRAGQGKAGAGGFTVL